MRKTMLLAAIVAALGTISQPAEAHDRGLSFRHFSGHAGPKLRLRDCGPMSHQGFFGKPQPFMRRHFSDSATEVSCAGSVTGTLCSNSVMCFRSSLAASDMDTAKAASSLGSIARGKRGGGTTAALFSKDPPLGHLRDLRDSIPRSQTGQGGGLHSAAPPEALLRRLEQMGFRHVPELRRESSR
jgi:hypothetical protein